MALPQITDFYIYKWRYWLGYGLVGVAFVALLVFAALYVPGGLSPEETQSAITSANLFTSENWWTSYPVIDLPYHLLQFVSFKLLGVTLLSIKLPSIILSVISAIAMVLLLRRWFTSGVAVLASILAVTTGQFIFIAQAGSPAIMPVFWSSTLLLVATYIANRVRPHILWKTIFFALAALSLYTPLSIYILIALGSAVILHPHLRFIIRRLSWKRAGIAFFVATILLVPLAWGIYQDPSLGLNLLGIPTELPNFSENLVTLAIQYFGFMSVGSGTVMTPVFGLGSTLIILFGLYRSVKTHQTVQGYVVLAWLLCILPLLVLNPTYGSIMFVLHVLLLSTGLETILRSWYRMFPRNPYARFAGLIPLVVLVGGLMLFGVERYMYGYHYAPTIARNFSHDLQLLPANTTTIVVSNEERSLYDAVALFDEDFSVHTSTPPLESFTVTHDAKSTPTPGYTIDSIITSPFSEDSDRFYIYKKSTN